MKLIKLGVVPYGQALALQYQLRAKLQSQSATEGTENRGYIVCLQHTPVITLGKRGKLSDILAPQWFAAHGFEVFKTDRGGEATYHGPGQLVVYPVLRLDGLGMGVVDIVRGLAECIAQALHEYGVEAVYDVEHPGLWTTSDPIRKKIASVGMRVSGGVTTHGAAVNLTNDLTPFSMFVPCGMPGTPVARLNDYCVSPVDVEHFSEKLLQYFEKFLGHSLTPISWKLPAPEAWVAPLQWSQMNADSPSHD